MSTGHIASSAARTSSVERVRSRTVPESTWSRLLAASASNKACSTNLRAALCVCARRAAPRTMRRDVSTSSRNEVRPNGTTRSRGNARWRSRTAFASSAAIRTWPFTRAGRGRVGRLDPHRGHEVREHDLLDPGLAERRQHAVDVPQEHTVRPDDEHALVLEREAVRVEEVRRAVQRDDCLARAGTALHDEDAVQRRADDLVLLGLDRGDDVAELTGRATARARRSARPGRPARHRRRRCHCR